MNATNAAKLRGLYVVTDNVLTPPGVLQERVALAISGGARVVQYRDKIKCGALALVRELAALCHRHGAPLIINDDAQLARDAGADGVHLGRDDAGVDAARRILGPNAIIGVSCYDRLDLAVSARESGASYVAFGRFFPSLTKPQAVHAAVELIPAARRRLDLPICAIGGIDGDNAGRLVEAGADMVAVVGGVFAQRDIAAAAGRISRWFV